MSEQGPLGPDLSGDFDKASMDPPLDQELEYDAQDWPELDDHFDLSEVYPSPGGSLEESVSRQVSGQKREEYSHEVHGELSRLEDERELDFNEEFAQVARPEHDGHDHDLSDEFHQATEHDLTRDEIRELIDCGDIDAALESRSQDWDRDDGPER